MHTPCRRAASCNNSVCRVPGENGRYTSFYPLRTDAMAIAFSRDEWATLDISPHPAPEGAETPDQPIWISVAGPALRDVTALPAGARSFVSPLESAKNVTVAIVSYSEPAAGHTPSGLPERCRGGGPRYETTSGD